MNLWGYFDKKLIYINCKLVYNSYGSRYFRKNVTMKYKKGCHRNFTWIKFIYKITASGGRNETN